MCRHPFVALHVTCPFETENGNEIGGGVCCYAHVSCRRLRVRFWGGARNVTVAFPVSIPVCGRVYLSWMVVGLPSSCPSLRLDHGCRAEFYVHRQTLVRSPSVHTHCAVRMQSLVPWSEVVRVVPVPAHGWHRHRPAMIRSQPSAFAAALALVIAGTISA